MKQKWDPHYILFTLLLFPLFYLIGNHLFEETQFPVWLKWAGWIYLSLHYALVMWIPLVFWRMEKPGKPSKKQQVLFIFSNFVLVTLSFFTVLQLIRYVAWIFTRKEWLYGNVASAVILTLSYLLLVLGAFIALRTPKIHHVELKFERLPASFDGFRIVQLSDLHISPLVRKGFVGRVVRRVNSLEADMIALTGDVFDNDPERLRAHVAPLKALSATHGVFFVTGNHEYYWDHRKALKLVDAFGFNVLYNRHVCLEKEGERIVVAGVSDLQSKRIAPETAEGCDPDKAFAGTHQDQFKLLLAHNPKVVEHAARHQVSLQLSGHTHGGQFYPWNVLIRLIHKYHKGLSEYRGVKLYVSKGTGFWGPPNRLGASPEITLLTLRSCLRG